MRKLLAATAVAFLSFTTVAAGPAAQQTPDGFVASFQLGSGDTASYDGASGTGGATFVDGCDGTVGTCDYILLEATAGGTLAFDFHAAYDPADFDVHVYSSDADGTIGEEVASSGNFFFPVSTGFGLEPNEFGSFDTAARKFYAVEVDYYLAGGGYTIDFSLS